MGYNFELRKNLILEKLEREGSILVKELAETLAISETTIRRDLNELDAQGLLSQVYGGAVRNQTSLPALNYAISNRYELETEAKKIIGKAAATLVQDNEVIYIDPGTTSWEMIPYLKTKKNLTIISNSARIMLCLEHIGHHKIVQLGGTFRPERLDTVGTLVQIGIAELRGYTAFQGGDGIDLSFGLSAIDHESALAAKTILANASKTVALADHTKFEHPNLLYKIVELDRINILVTDRPLSEQWQSRCAELNITVVVAH